MATGEKYAVRRQQLTDRHHKDDVCPTCGLRFQTRYYCEITKKYMYRHPAINRGMKQVRPTKYCEAER